MRPKKSDFKIGIIAILIICILTGCATGGRSTNGTSMTSQTQTQQGNTTNVGSSGQTGYVAPVVEEVAVDNNDQATAEEQLSARVALGLTTDGIEQKKSEQSGRYCYDTMDAQYHALYVELLTIVQNNGEDIRISTQDSDALQYAFLCMFYDHPELYWIDGYTYTRYEDAEGGYFTFSGRYTYTKAEQDSYKFYIDQYYSRVLATVSSTASQYEKVKAVYEFIAENTEYNVDARDNQNLLSVVLYGESVCQGYVKAMQYILERMGVSSTMVVGRVASGEGHAWLLVNIDGAYYYTDPTWGDTSYSSDSQSYNLLGRMVNYEYLNITSEEIDKTHQSANVVPLPCCVATAANYYVMENLYFTSYDETQLKEVFNRAFENGDEVVTIKCSDDAVYQSMYDELITNQKVCSYYPSDRTTFEYVMSQEQRTMWFWL